MSESKWQSLLDTEWLALGSALAQLSKAQTTNIEMAIIQGQWVSAPMATGIHDMQTMNGKCVDNEACEAKRNGMIIEYFIPSVVIFGVIVISKI